MKARLYQRHKWSKRLYNDLVMRTTLQRYLLDRSGKLIDWIKVLGLRSCVIYTSDEADHPEIGQVAKRLDVDLMRTAGDLMEGRPRSAYQVLLDRLRPVLRLIAFEERYAAVAYSYYEVIVAALFNRGDARARVRRRILRVLRV
jgi:hypothetical protein